MPTLGAWVVGLISREQGFILFVRIEEGGVGVGGSSPQGSCLAEIYAL